MSFLVIQGGRVISGVHAVSGNKNAALPMIAAALLTSEPVTLENVPDIADVTSMLDAAKTFGAQIVRDSAAGTVTLVTPKIRSVRISRELAAQTRTSFLFAGPLLARTGRAS
ncbi:MAG TPA: UDP-N-acetylglucosamine 1-carboxyvinyltransferase, partial [Verrucomicrobia bacterium]|nr:UDP-N-acetylglucosamine 1-carboxyvinyltransferase [Verrucomicrobiota bacterium]